MNLKHFLLKDGLVAWAALTLTIVSLYKQCMNERPTLTGAVRQVIKGEMIRTFTNNTAELKTSYTLYLQLTNTGRVPIDINFINVEAFQDGIFNKLQIALDPLNYFKSAKGQIIVDLDKLSNNIFYNNSVIEPGLTLSGYIVCFGEDLRWNSEFTKAFRVIVYDKRGDEHIIEADMVNGLEVLPEEVVENKTGVRFENLGHRPTPISN